MISGVCERDLDLMLLEEFLSSPTFASWFAKEAGVSGLDEATEVTAKRSVTQSNGESDLEVEAGLIDGRRLLLLIENKVRAGSQPQQAERYRVRASTYVERVPGAVARTVLVAPNGYLSEGADHGYDAHVSYEAVRDWFQFSDLGLRRGYKLALLDSAIAKSCHGYVPVPDEPVTAFWMQYWQLVQEIAPELEMRPPPEGVPSGSWFIRFKPGLPRGVFLLHKLLHGNVDLEFRRRGSMAGVLRHRLQHVLEPDMEVTPAESSAAIRLHVTPLNTAHSFSTHSAAAREGIAATQRLHAWWRRNAGVVLEVLASLDRRDEP